MRTIRLHLVGIVLAVIGLVTSMPQPPVRHHGPAMRSAAQVQLDDDNDDRDGEGAILEEEAASAEAAASERRRRT